MIERPAKPQGSSLDELFFRQHALVENAKDCDGSGLDPVKHYMRFVFHAAQTWQYVIAGTAQLRIIRELLATRFYTLDVAYCLVFAPDAQGIAADFDQVCLCQT